MANIKDVARRAGVSTATVSHVINGTRVVLPETKQLVLKAIEELNYHPSALARGLTTNKTKTIGVMIADVTSPFFASLLRYVEAKLTAAGYNLFVCNTYEQPSKEHDNLALLLEKRVDGIILTPTGASQTMYEQLNAHHIPLVFVDRKPPDAIGAFVGTDNVKGTYEATKYLRSLGHEYIALISMKQETTPVLGRVSGYQQAAVDLNIPADKQMVVYVEYDVEAACEATCRLLAQSPATTAIIAGNHIITLGVLKALRKQGLQYPQDISLICFDNSRWTEVVNPSLTVVVKPLEELATTAVKTLMENIKAVDQNSSKQNRKVDLLTAERLLETELIIRESCRPPR